MEFMDAAQLVVDTDIVIDYLRQYASTLEKVITLYNCGITAVTLYELRVSLAKSERQQKRFAQVFPYLKVIPFDQVAAESASDIWRTLQANGSLIGLPDTLIAGTCLAHNLPFLTRNQRHYQRVANLKILTPDDIKWE